MKILFDEISRRFPEIRGEFSEIDEELPYVVMGYLPSWLKSLPKEALTPELIDRLVAFTKWCTEQPRGKDASDDVYTMLSVSFYEKLFDSDTTRALLPKFISHDEFIASGDYFRAWVGTEDYEKALKCYESVT